MLSRLGALLSVLAAVAMLLLPTVAAQPATFDVVAHQGRQGATTGESLRAFSKSLELGQHTGIRHRHH